MLSHSENDNQHLLRAFLTLALPTVFEHLLGTVLQYVDTAMVGHLGAKATASISLSTTYSWFFGSVMSAIGIGFLSYIARAIGEKNDYKIKHALGMAFDTAIVLGLLLTVVTMILAPFIPKWMGAEESIWAVGTRYYMIVNIPLVLRCCLTILASVLRATGDSKTPMRINLFVNVLNIVFNYIFIYIVGMGVIGAGVATAIAYTIGGVLIITAFLHNEKVSRELQYFKLEKNILFGALSIGIPAMLTRMVSCLGHIVATSFVSSMGTVIFAAHSIAITAEQLFYIPGYGMQAATSTLIGNSVGEKDTAKEYKIMRISISLVVLVMLISGIILYVGAHGMMSLFTTDKEVVNIGTGLLKIVALTEPLYGLYIVMDGIYVGLGKTNIPLIIEFVGHWGIRILSAFILIRYFNAGINEYWYCMIADNITKALLLTTGLYIIVKKSQSVMKKEVN